MIAPAGADAGSAPLTAAGAPTSITQIASETLRQALGWRYRPEDARGFSSALNRAVTVTRGADGEVNLAWSQQPVSGDNEAIEITGAQWSVLEQARTLINYALPLLDGLKPLRVDADPEDIAAVSSIVRLKLNTILEELGRSGGPRVQRLDLVFEELLGLPVLRFHASGNLAKGRWEVVSVPDSDTWIHQLDALDATRTDKNTSYSLLRQLCDEYGLDPKLANTVEEERDFTNALIIIDTVIGLRTAWIGKRAYFDRANRRKPRFLGTQLVWLSRQLDVVAEAIREAYAAMDSVYFRKAERIATDIHFAYDMFVDERFVVGPKKGGETVAEAFAEYETTAAPLSVAELLDWVEAFATQEGPRLLQDAGKDGVLAFRSTVGRLTKWVAAARRFSESGTGNAPRSFFTSRVQFALREIETQLAITGERASGISRTTRDVASTGAPLADLPPAPAANVTAVGPVGAETDPAIEIIRKVTTAAAKNV
jgi:hypothetical protein